MKIEQLLVQHFYQNREVTLQGMGSFTLSGDVIVPQESDKEVVMPENAISFQYNPKATEDDGLINFIVQQTRKIKPLASADLDSYLVLGKQFLNIGKPFKVEGIGTLEKNQQGEYEFKQGHFANTKMESAPTALREKAEDDDISFAAIKNRPAGGKKILLIVVAIVALVMIGWAAWYFLHKKKDNSAEANDNTEQTVPLVVTAPDTSSIIAPRKDSVIVQPPVVPPVVTPTVVTNNTAYNFMVVFKETNNKGAAIIKMNDLIARGHKVVMYTKDSVYYKLAEPFRRPLSDTARVRDSLNKYYYLGKAYVEQN